MTALVLVWLLSGFLMESPEGDIKEICDIVEPDYGILTAIGPQHLDTFKSIDNVRKTKLELVDSLPNDGIAFVNWEDENIRNSKISKNMIKFGLTKEADYYAKNITSRVSSGWIYASPFALTSCAPTERTFSVTRAPMICDG